MVARYEVKMTPRGYYTIMGHNNLGLFKTEKEVEEVLTNKFKSGEMQEAEIWFN